MANRDKMRIRVRLNKKVNTYYHIAEIENLRSIIEKGLRASRDGYIYLLISRVPAAYVAKNQLGLIDYALLSIEGKGIIKTIERDNVGEITWPFQRRVKQALIKSKYIKLVGAYLDEDEGRSSITLGIGERKR